MPEVFVAPPQPFTVPAPVGADAQRAARTALRGQIARLESELSAALVEVFAMRGEAPARTPAATGSAAGPRLLDLGELECVRDQLAHRLAHSREDIGRRREAQREARARLQEMLLEPGRHRLRRVSLRELGEPGCGVYSVAPRLGLVGMLAGWWEVKLSSGCPLCRWALPTAHPRLSCAHC